MSETSHELKPSLSQSPTQRHQIMSRWHSSPSSRDLCHARLLTRLRQNHEMRSLIVDRMRKVNINDMNDMNADNESENFVDEELQQIINSDVDMLSFSEQELQELTKGVKQEFLEEQNKYWEGLQTKREQENSQRFLNALQSRHALICPYCKTFDLQIMRRYLVCDSCCIRFDCGTIGSVDEVIQRIYNVLNVHSMTGCKDQYPQYSFFQSNLVIYCDTCPLNQSIL